jgi:hypothetical protein
MTGLSALWLPILVSAVLVFVASSLLHMALPWHKSDYAPVPREKDVLDALRPLAIPPGDYMVPCPATREELGSPDFKAKVEKGPVMVVTILPNGPMPMGRNLAQWLLYCTAVGFMAAYVAGRTLPPGTPYLRIFQLIGATAFIGYALALWQMSIWYRRSWMTTIKATVDGLIYACLTAGTFGWLWPK